MRTIFGFVRHGQTDWNYKGRIQGTIDNPLNEEGIKQAHQLGQFLSEHDREWNMIFTSPLQRAKSTAEILSEYLPKVPIHVNPHFMEREFGDAEGCLITKELFDHIVADEVFGLEPSYLLQNRIESEVKALTKEYEGQRILVVAHSHVIKGLLTKIDPKYTFRDRMENGSITYFVVEAGEVHLLSLNVRE
jgi:broad specificity phosphatase PhoE